MGPHDVFASQFEDLDLRDAAAVVMRDDRGEAARAELLRALDGAATERGWKRLLRACVPVWGRNSFVDDEGVTAAISAWVDTDGCEACALAALAGRSGCDRHAEVA